MNFHEDFVIKSAPTGSNYICNPPVTTTDIDTVFLVRPTVTDEHGFTVSYAVVLTDAGWAPCVGEGYEILGGDFTAWRKGNKNYICTTDPVFYKKYVLATKICKMMNLLYKADRIWMFKVVMHGQYLPSNSATVETPVNTANQFYAQWNQLNDELATYVETFETNETENSE